MASSRIVDPRIEAEEIIAESRGDVRRAERVKEDALARLSSDLCGVSAKKLAQLELPDEVVDAIGDARAITSAPARNRQLRKIRGLLRDLDWVSLRTRLDTLLETGVVPGVGAAPADPVSDATLGWTLRLVGEGQAGIDAFVAEFPRADRTHLRQLVRAVHKAEGDRRLRAEKQLTAALRGFLR
ncbi:MAG TPA: ribosome biogenesis factor YjgA [Polyangiaceae bacterium]|nr:ribosome biogenesis factor YjgA [Polyangiaceae bacterium]